MLISIFWPWDFGQESKKKNRKIQYEERIYSLAKIGGPECIFETFQHLFLWWKLV